MDAADCTGLVGIIPALGLLTKDEHPDGPILLSPLAAAGLVLQPSLL
jgi:hypothetical protein